MKYSAHIIVCSLLFLSPVIGLAGKKTKPRPQNSPTAMTPDAAAFLGSAIDVMQQHSLRSQSVDWTDSGRGRSGTQPALSTPSILILRFIGRWSS